MFATTQVKAKDDGSLPLGANPTYYALSDSTKLSIADENYGAELAFNLFGGSYTIGNIKEGNWEYDSKGKLKTTSIQSGIEKLNTYNGWLAFGSLKLGAGVWKDGLLDGNYRVKKDADAGSYEGIDFEANKLGTIFKNTEITFIDDMANFDVNK